MAELKLGLAGKFVSLSFIMTLVILMSISGVFIQQLSRAMSDQTSAFVRQLEDSKRQSEAALKTALLAKGRLLNNTLAQSAGGMILNYDYETVKQLATNAETDAEIDLVEFLDAEGNPITENGGAGGKNEFLLEQDIRSGDEILGKVRMKLSSIQMEQKLAQLDQEIQQQQELSKTQQDEAKNRIITRLIIFSLIGLLILGGMLYLLLVKLITRPLARGVSLAENIRKGDLSQRLNMKSGDEIGKLANALDSMANGLSEKVELADQIAEGNLDVEVPLASDRDQLGQALRKMADTLNELLGKMQGSSNQISSNAAQVSDSSQILSQGATEQAASMEEITSSMNVILSQTRQSADNATQARDLSSSAAAAAERGNNQMQKMTEAMEEINHAGQDINKIIKVIDEIAFQTNLLALNAAVEAARAGQHGKGFAVVAEEVRNLAARSAKAAQETSDLIEGSVSKAENGSAIARGTAAALEEIVIGITKVNDLAEEIASSSQEQAQGIAQITEGLAQIDQVTQQNTATAEESAAAAEELSGQSVQMQQMLAHFHLKQDNLSVQAPTASPYVAAPSSEISLGWTGLDATPKSPAISLND